MVEAVRDPFYSFIGLSGITIAMGLACISNDLALGAACGLARSGSAIATIGTFKPHLIIKSIFPVILSSTAAINGLVTSLMIYTKSI